jgi:hypothetical protein
MVSVPRPVIRLLWFADEANSILDRALAKPGPVKEEKDDMRSRCASMTREERLREMQRLLESVNNFLPTAPKRRRLSSQSAT